MWASFYGDREKPGFLNRISNDAKTVKKPGFWGVLHKSGIRSTIRNINKTINLKDFVLFYEWQGIFHGRDEWSESFWEWTH